MKKFRFKFAAVFKLRKTREEEALRALGHAQSIYQGELARKAHLVNDLENALVRREELADRPIDIRAYQLEQAFIVGTKQRIIQADQGILRASRGVEKALRAYLGARRQTRMIEVLHDKAYVEFRREVAKKENRAMDELTILRARLANQEENTA